MKESLLIKYDFDAEQGFDLALIGSSFIGFDKVIKELLLGAGLSEKVEVRTTRVRQGSVEVFNALVILDPLFIQDPKQLLEFLKLAAPEFQNSVNTFLAVKDNLNEYYKDRPLDFEFSALVSYFILRSLYLAGKAKLGDKRALEESGASPRQIARLKKMVKRGHFKKALEPITKGNVSKVQLETVGLKKNQEVAITEKNVGDFLPDEDQILPQFEDGDSIRITGELLAMGSTHGDSMKIRVRDIDPDNSLLVATLAEGLDIVDYRNLFKQAVFVEAQVKRKTMYKRPELVVTHMSSLQEKLDI